MTAPRWLGALGAVLVVAGIAFALRAGFGDLLTKTSLEQQTRTVAQQLRCPVCEGQSVAESDSAVANDMRSEIRERLQAGEPPAAILDSFEDRYGAWIINHPPARGWYVLVWAAPFLAAGAGAFALGRYIARQRPAVGQPAEDTGSQASGDAPADSGRSVDHDVAERLKDYL